jgi:hypothetical protein
MYFGGRRAGNLTAKISLKHEASFWLTLVCAMPQGGGGQAPKLLVSQGLKRFN